MSYMSCHSLHTVVTLRLSTDSYRNLLPCLARTEQSATNEICKQDFHCLQLGIATVQFATFRFRVGFLFLTLQTPSTSMSVCACVALPNHNISKGQNVHRMNKLRDFGMAKTPAWILSSFYAAWLRNPLFRNKLPRFNRCCFLCLWFGCFQKSISAQLVLDRMWDQTT